MKPRVFLSHSSKDAKALRALKDSLVLKTGNTVEFFLASDGQSIPLGGNWVHRIEQALETSNLMFVFLSPSSIKSQWVYFEAGYAYSKKIRVVPVGIMGADLTALPPPISLLHGFNVRSADSLDNILALLNETFGHSHASTFTGDEFASIFGGTQDDDASRWVKLAEMVDSIRLDSTYGFGEIPKAASAVLAGADIPFHLGTSSVRLNGAVLSETTGPNKVYFEAEFDPALFPVTLPLVQAIERELIAQNRTAGTSFRVFFYPNVIPVGADYKLTARLAGSPVRFAADGSLVYKEMSFEFAYLDYATDGISYIFLRVKTGLPELSEQVLAELIDLLFERGVLLGGD
jgi:hypothetical protein